MRNTLGILAIGTALATLAGGCVINTGGGGYYGGSRDPHGYPPASGGAQQPYTPPPPAAQPGSPTKPTLRPGVGRPTAVPAPEEPPTTRSPAQQFTPGLGDGMPPGYPAGRGNGFWAWRDGSVWHLHTTTDGGQQRFRGRIVGLQGEISDIRASNPFLASRLRKSPQGDWIFDFATTADGDGFAFQVSGSSCVKFDLDIGPASITVGSQSLHPLVQNFVLCPAQPGAAPRAAPSPARRPVRRR